MVVQKPKWRAWSAWMFPFAAVAQSRECLRGLAGEVFRSAEVRPLAANRPPRLTQVLVTSAAICSAASLREVRKSCLGRRWCRRCFVRDRVPGVLAALRTLHVPTRPACGLPSDAAQLPNGSREAARASHDPGARMSLHGLGPAPRQNRFEHRLDKTHNRYLVRVGIITPRSLPLANA
jgi:hypothetical protein